MSNTNQPNPRYFEILAEEAAKDPQNEHFLSATGGDFEEALKRLPSMQFILSGRSIISAMQRAVEEALAEKSEVTEVLVSQNKQLTNELTTLRTELDRVRGAVDSEYHGKPISYWKENAQEDYMSTPISVLKYITILEEALNCGLKTEGGGNDNEKS